MVKFSLVLELVPRTQLLFAKLASLAQAQNLKASEPSKALTRVTQSSVSVCTCARALSVDSRLTRRIVHLFLARMFCCASVVLRASACVSLREFSVAS